MIRVIYANKTNISKLSKLAKLCFVDTFSHLYSKEDLNAHLKDTCSNECFSKALSEDIILLAENDSGLVGYLKLGRMSLPLENIAENSAEIHRLYIHPDYKQQGIGTELMNRAFETSEFQKAENIYLSVYEDNIEAQRFYKKYGFSKVGEYDYYVGSHIDREYIMHLRK